MEYIITWLISLETLAKNIYTDAITYFKEDDLLIKFLADLIKDEVLHSKLLNNALPLINEMKLSKADLILDDRTKEKIEKPLFLLFNKMRGKTLSKNEFYSLMINAEYSEWNTIFIYVLQSLALTDKQFQYAASVIQTHENRFEAYFSETDINESCLRIIHSFPVVWKKKILVVDDTQANVGLLDRILRNEFTVDTAPNGKEALEKAVENYYDIILSDVSMPVMDGVEFFSELSKSDKHIEKHFIFMTGDETNISRFPKNVNYILKPYDISELRNKIKEMITSL